tara:strand:+ start:814 stop:1665 length:852 start_codon:yes stop_codon:yes gene_type:complete
VSNTSTDITNSNEQSQHDGNKNAHVQEGSNLGDNQQEKDNKHIDNQKIEKSEKEENKNNMDSKESVETINEDVMGDIVNDTDESEENSETNDDVLPDVEKKPGNESIANNLNWYIVQTLSNYEKRVETRVQQVIDAGKYDGKLFRVLVPTQQTVELKNNKRLEKVTKIFPGYVFIQMNIEDELAYELRQIPGIAKFVGIGNKPSPVVEDEILKVLRKVGDTSKEIDVDFEVGEVIKVVDGPFRGYTGSISEINSLKGNIKAKISIFGRETPVELDFEQVEKTV